MLFGEKNYIYFCSLDSKLVKLWINSFQKKIWCSVGQLDGMIAIVFRLLQTDLLGTMGLHLQLHSDAQVSENTKYSVYGKCIAKMQAKILLVYGCLFISFNGLGLFLWFLQY